MASDEFEIQVKIDTANAPTRYLKLVVKESFEIQRLKGMLEEKEGINSKIKHGLISRSILTNIYMSYLSQVWWYSNTKKTSNWLHKK